MTAPRDKPTAAHPIGKKLAKRGRKPLFSDSMSPAQRKAKQRREQDARIVATDAEGWTESDCIRVLTTKKFTPLHRLAWERIGEIKGYM